jgi:phosphoribosylaminoimidazole-succinocarboxamide synthase
MTTTAPLLVEGKTKIIREGQSPEELRVTFKDQATAFNGQKIVAIPGKGALNAKISVQLFKLLKGHDIPTCFVGPGASAEELVYTRLQMLPLEIVIRNFAYGSVCRRFGFEEGRAFQKPLIEFFLKDDASNDPQITDEMIEELGLLPPQVSLEEVKRLAFQVNEVFLAYFQVRGIRCADFKLEFGLNAQGRLVIGDELSPDNFRLRDQQTGEVLDKDVFRLDLGDLVQTYEKLLARMSSAPNPPSTVDRVSTYRAEIFVKSRQNILSPESKAILEALHTMGYSQVQALQAGKRFEILLDAPSLKMAEKQLQTMAETILSNPVIEEYDFTLKLI